MGVLVAVGVAERAGEAGWRTALLQPAIAIVAAKVRQARGTSHRRADPRKGASNVTYGTRPSADVTEKSSLSSRTSVTWLRHLDGMKIGMIMAVPRSRSTPLDSNVLKPAA